MIGKCPQEEKPSDVCTYAHNFTIDSEEDKVDTPDVKGEIMRSIAAKMGIPYPYLSKVTMAEAKRVVSKCTGYIYGTKNRTIVSLNWIPKMQFLSSVMKGQVDENDVCFIFIPFGHVV